MCQNHFCTKDKMLTFQKSFVYGANERYLNKYECRPFYELRNCQSWYKTYKKLTFHWYKYV